MNHNWREKRFICNGTFEGENTCVQEWTCSYCEKHIALPYGVKPNVPGECIDTRKQREEMEERKRQIAAKSPKGWGNGSKARGRKNGT